MMQICFQFLHAVMTSLACLCLQICYAFGQLLWLALCFSVGLIGATAIGVGITLEGFRKLYEPYNMGLCLGIVMLPITTPFIFLAVTGMLTVEYLKIIVRELGEILYAPINAFRYDFYGIDPVPAWNNFFKAQASAAAPAENVENPSFLAR